MSDTDPFLETMRRQSGRADFELPSESGPEGNKTSGVVEVDDTLADALRFVNKKFEELLQSGQEFPDDAIPELQKLGQMQIQLHNIGQTEMQSQGGGGQFGPPDMGGEIPML